MSVKERHIKIIIFILLTVHFGFDSCKLALVWIGQGILNQKDSRSFLVLSVRISLWNNEQKKPQSASTFQTCNLNVICIWVIVIDVNKDCKQLIANLFKMFGAIRRTDLWNIWHLISTSSPELFPKHEQFVSKIRTDFN